ncbi:MAG: discoidin domain-containing protein [Pseudodesulfovibrio sp.]|nr:discoidin domain-containing protein [Pseudodesulfovibrio sp.]
MALTPKESGDAGGYPIPFWAIMTSITSSPTLYAGNYTISLWYNDPGTSDEDHVFIQSDSGVIYVTINNGTSSEYTGTVGSTYGDLISNVLIEEFGEYTGGWGDLFCMEGLVDIGLFVSGSGNGCVAKDVDESSITFGSTDSRLDFSDADYLGFDTAQDVELSYGSTDLCTGGTAISSSNYSASYNAEKAFDNSIDTYWQAGVVGIGEYIGYLFGVTITLGKAQYYTWNILDYVPSSVKIQYTTDGGANWADAQTFTGVRSGLTWITLTLDTPVECNGFRIANETNPGGQWIAQEVGAYNAIYDSPNSWDITATQATEV